MASIAARSSPDFPYVAASTRGVMRSFPLVPAFVRLSYQPAPVAARAGAAGECGKESRVFPGGVFVTNGYHIALFIHLLALVAASAAAAIVHFAGARGGRATSPDEALQWRDLVDSTEKVFPAAVVTLFATGVFMMYQAGWMWSAGWIVAGILGAVTLAVIGRILGFRGAASRREIVHAREAGGPVPPADVPETVLSWCNTGLAVAIVFVMVTKPTLPGALLSLLVGFASGGGIGLRAVRQTHAAPRRAEA
jgi:uncharacterized membrane protein